jgi:hypothetical protein
VWLNIGGGILEIGGFGIVAYELFRTQRRDLGDPWLLARLKVSKNRVTGVFRRLFRRTESHEISASLTGTIELSGTLKAQRRRGRGQTLEDHVAALEQNFAELEKEVEEHRAELDTAIEGVSSELRETQVALGRQRQEREEEEKELLRASVTLQWWGISLFVAGVVASVAANVISCG